MNSVVMRIRTDKMIDTARNRSSRIGGSGRMRTTRMVITPIAQCDVAPLDEIAEIRKP